MTALRIPIEGEFEVTRPEQGLAGVKWPIGRDYRFVCYDHVPDWMTRDYPRLASAVRWVIECDGVFRGEYVKFRSAGLASERGCYVVQRDGTESWREFSDHPNEPDLQARRPKQVTQDKCEWCGGPWLKEKHEPKLELGELADDEARVNGKVVKLGKWQTRGWDGEVIEWEACGESTAFMLRSSDGWSWWKTIKCTDERNPCNVPGQLARLNAMWDEATGVS